MGCWNGTCMISNLPVIGGEEVKVVFLHSPFDKEELKKSAYCYPNGVFHPGNFALTGEYDDYGGVENIEEDTNFKLIELYFQTKYKKIKVEGEEKETFNLYDILNGIERGSLKVYTEGDVERKKMAEGAVNVYSKSGYSSEEVKEQWETLANMDVSEKWRSSNLNFVMIRKDVWDGIVKEHKTEFWKEDEDRKHPTDYYQTAQEWAAKRFNKFKKSEGIFRKFENPLSMAGYAGGNIMFMNQFYGTALEKADDELLDYFQTLFTEMTIIESFLGSTRKGWMIVSGAGSQSDDWGSYLLLNKIVDNICTSKLKEYEEDEE